MRRCPGGWRIDDDRWGEVSERAAQTEGREVVDRGVVEQEVVGSEC
jgi:hypothetical protein